MRKVFKKGKLVSLALFELDDADRLATWVNQEEIRHFLSRHLPMYTEQEVEWLKKLPGLQPNDIVLGIVKNDENKTLIGSIGLHRISHKDRRGHGGIFIGDENERQNGAGGEAARLMLDYAFDTLNLRKVVHEVFATNDGSIALAKKLGGIHEGTLKEHFYVGGRYIDLLIYSYFNPTEMR